jgi:murein DD-endopeptidase MepM/ murein hydrolase activator NlpD
MKPPLLRMTASPCPPLLRPRRCSYATPALPRGNWRRSFAALALLGLAATDGGGGGGTRLRLPVANSCVTSPFGPRRALGPGTPAGFHDGIDLRAPAGTPVVAIADGEVLRVHRGGPGGLFVTVRHGDLVALYAHLGRLTPALAEGARTLRQGETLGVAGRSGISYGAHLYFEVRRAGVALDPAMLFDVAACR